MGGARSAELADGQSCWQLLLTCVPRGSFVLLVALIPAPYQIHSLPAGLGQAHLKRAEAGVAAAYSVEDYERAKAADPEFYR